MMDPVKTTIIVRGVYFSEFMSIRCYVGDLYGELSVSSQSKMLCTIAQLQSHVDNEPVVFGISINDRVVFESSFCLTDHLLLDGGEVAFLSSFDGAKGVCRSMTPAPSEEKPAAVAYNFSIRSVFPRSGLTSGNTVVRIGLLGVTSTSGVQCLFDGLAMP
eukprot:gene26680-33601_t